LVGKILKKAREESGKDLKTISQILKIRYDYLNAIEEGDFKQLPEEVYIKGYIRVYAEFLHIDPETALQAYAKQKSPSKDEKKEIAVTTSDCNNKFKSKHVIILLLLLFFGLILIFIFPSSKEKSESSQTSVKTKNIILPPKINPAEVAPVPLETKNKESLSLAEKKPEVITSPRNTIKDSAINKEPAGENIIKTSVPQHVLKVTATDTVWLLVTIDKTSKKEMLLKPGEIVTFQAKEDFSLKVGNAGGVEIVFDGKTIGKLGKQGQVINLTLPEKM
jgi:cytoskeleton protein RodZ